MYDAHSSRYGRRYFVHSSRRRRQGRWLLVVFFWGERCDLLVVVVYSAGSSAETYMMAWGERLACCDLACFYSAPRGGGGEGRTIYFGRELQVDDDMWGRTRFLLLRLELRRGNATTTRSIYKCASTTTATYWVGVDHHNTHHQSWAEWNDMHTYIHEGCGWWWWSGVRSGYVKSL